ncbi:MAG: hypothetical protein ABFS45_13885 [Pseudomonadota bacterium]
MNVRSWPNSGVQTYSLRQVFAEFPAIGLFALRSIDALKADAVLCVVGIENRDGIAMEGLIEIKSVYSNS